MAMRVAISGWRRLRSHQQQTADVDAGNQQNGGGREPEQPQRIFKVSGHRLLQRGSP